MAEDFPLEDLARAAEPLVAAGHVVIQKWTCGKCGERVASTESNVFHTSMKHEDCPIEPGYVTQTPTGNYTVIAGEGKSMDLVRRVLDNARGQGE